LTSTPLTPVSIWKKKTAAAIIAPPTASRLSSGSRVTARVMASQNPRPESSVESGRGVNTARPMNGKRRELTRGPSSARTAGRRVKVAASVTRTTIIAPRPRDWKKEDGIISIPQRAKTTVNPLNSTVRPAVAPALPTASRTLCPCRNSPR